MAGGPRGFGNAGGTAGGGLTKKTSKWSRPWSEHANVIVFVLSYEYDDNDVWSSGPLDSDVIASLSNEAYGDEPPSTASSEVCARQAHWWLAMRMRVL